VADKHPEAVSTLEAAYDRWWASVQPQLVNERAVGPAVNPFKEIYWKQYRGPGPNQVTPEQWQRFGINVTKDGK
jgi:arylsulfatase